MSKVPTIPRPENPIKVLYLDVAGVLQYADRNQWRPRLEAEAFLAWAAKHFQCRWLTNWVDPNRSVPKELGIVIPAGIVEVRWRELGSETQYPFKAAAIRNDEDWYWLEDEPSEFDLAELRRWKQLSRLIVVDRHRPRILMSLIRELLEDRLKS